MLKTTGTLFLAVAVFAGINTDAGGRLDIRGVDRRGYFFGQTVSFKEIPLNADTLYLKPLLKGESVIATNDDVSDFLKKVNAIPVFTENLQEIVCEYYYSPEIPLYKSINGQKVNVHVATRNGKTRIGVPFIYGSY